MSVLVNLSLCKHSLWIFQHGALLHCLRKFYVWFQQKNWTGQKTKLCYVVLRESKGQLWLGSQKIGRVRD